MKDCMTEDDASFANRLEDAQRAIARSRAALAASQEVLDRTRGGSAGRQPAQLHPPASDAAFAQFAGLLKSSGVRDALAYLVSLSSYRFIGIFRFEDGRAAAAVHFDRKNPGQLTTDEVPDTATYCCYVRDSKGAFATADAMRDSRLETHVARDAVLAYCGVPIMDPEGQLLGTLCHYDLVPRDPETLDLPLLLRVASALQQSGQVPPYPRALGQR